jgi:large conductance mechanosensitive channel
VKKQESIAMLKEFKAFLLRGNLLDLAVAVVIGAAFTALVNSLVKSVVTPLIGAIFGSSTQFENLYIGLNGQKIYYGQVIDALITFILVSAVVFFLVIKPVNALMARLGRVADEAPMKSCPHCCSDVPEAATRCAYCTSDLVAAGA